MEITLYCAKESGGDNEVKMMNDFNTMVKIINRNSKSFNFSTADQILNEERIISVRFRTGVGNPLVDRFHELIIDTADNLTDRELISTLFYAKKEPVVDDHKFIY